VVDFAPSDRSLELRDRLRAFIAERIVPREAELIAAIDDEVAPGVGYPAAIRELRAHARAEGLWNLWLANHHDGPGLTNVEYGVLCEEMGYSLLVAPAVFNCSFPDTGNAEVLLEYGTPEQVVRFARPLLEDDVRSCFALTEPRSRRSCPTRTPTTSAARSPTRLPPATTTMTCPRLPRCCGSTSAVSSRSPAPATTPPTHHPDDTIRGVRTHK
jgi:acyl-CoA dehydrogenase